MSNKTKHALVGTLGRGRNTNINSICSVFCTSIEIESAFVYSYCVKYLLTGLF